MREKRKRERGEIESNLQKIKRYLIIKGIDQVIDLLE